MRIECPNGCGVDSWSRVELLAHMNACGRPPQPATVADRRQRAREAGYDADQYDATRQLEAAIETATRVRVTPEILAAFGAARRVPGQTSRSIAGTPHARRLAGLIAAFRAAGFEVEE